MSDRIVFVVLSAVITTRRRERSPVIVKIDVDVDIYDGDAIVNCYANYSRSTDLISIHHSLLKTGASTTRSIVRAVRESIDVGRCA